MASNIMKYTLVDEDGVQKTVKVDMAKVTRIRKNAGISVKAAVIRYLDFQAGRLTEEECFGEAKAAETSAAGKAKRKAPTRKVDVDKKTIIASLFDYFQSGQVSDALAAAGCGVVDTVVVENDQRLIRFTVDGSTYDLTLARKRK